MILDRLSDGSSVWPPMPQIPKLISRPDKLVSNLSIHSSSLKISCSSSLQVSAYYQNFNVAHKSKQKSMQNSMYSRHTFFLGGVLHIKIYAQMFTFTSASSFVINVHFKRKCIFLDFLADSFIFEYLLLAIFHK